MVVNYSSLSKKNLVDPTGSGRLNFPGLSKSENDELQKVAHLKECERDEILIGEQDNARIVGGVISGVLRMQKTLVDGRFHIVGFRLPGHTFGRLFSAVSSVSVEAATKSVVWVAERKALEAVVGQNRGIERRFFEDALAELDEARERMVLLGSASVNERLARFVLRYADGRNVVRIPVGRRDLAAVLGTTVESISRFGHELVERGIGRFRGADTIEVHDWKGLLAMAGITEAGSPFSNGALPMDSPRDRLEAGISRPANGQPQGNGGGRAVAPGGNPVRRHAQASSSGSRG